MEAESEGDTYQVGELNVFALFDVADAAALIARMKARQRRVVELTVADHVGQPPTALTDLGDLLGVVVDVAISAEPAPETSSTAPASPTDCRRRTFRSARRRLQTRRRFPE
jgi:hypothetical protein